MRHDLTVGGRVIRSVWPQKGSCRQQRSQTVASIWSATFAGHVTSSTWGDEFTHRIYRVLNSTFVTPLDRDFIRALASKIDHFV